MKRWLSAITVALVLLAASSHPAVSARTPLVLAFYYDWFDMTVWKPSQVADIPAKSYTSHDPQAVARQIQQARGAGIDAFVVSWWGAGNPTDDNLRILLDQARAADFQIAVDFEVTSPFYRTRDDVVNSLRQLLQTHANHPAYLRVGGKPVVFFWRQVKYPVAVWQVIRNAIDPQKRSLWISEGVDTSYQSVFDGHHLYSIAWSGNVAGELSKYADRVRRYGSDKIWVATTMPGYDDTRTNRKDAFVRSRRGGEFYRETWRGAIATSPEWIIVNSWNEWVEGSMIEPSVTYGDLYLNITRDFAAQYKGVAAPPPPKAPAVPTATRTATTKPTATPTRIPGSVRGSVTDTVRVRADPSTSAAILGRLAEGAGVAILAKSSDGKWWQIAYPNTIKRGWISAEFTVTQDNPDALPVIQGPTPTSAPPTATSPVVPEVFLYAATPEPELEPTKSAMHAASPEATATPKPLFPWLGSIFSFLP